jgi:lipopolysaccharide biosynthesis glycosyltransferase
VATNSLAGISSDDIATSDADPVVVLAADDGFAMPLAVTIRSAIEHLAVVRTLIVYVLDGGIRPETKQRIERSWPVGRYRLHWIAVDPDVLAQAPISGHANRVNYYRVLTPWLLPTSVRRAIYLDADLIVRRDLTLLWQSDLEDRLCLAVQDCAAPYVDSSVALANYAWCGPHLGSATPVANYRQLALNPQAEYFNSGVLLLDLEAWRKEDLPRRLLDCLTQNEPHVLWWDQYALNVVLAGRWGPLDLRWNQGSHIYNYPTWFQSPYDRATFERLRDDPYVIHFTTRYKPWLTSCLHPRRREFFQYVDRTDWAHWRPWQTNRLQSAFEIARAHQRRLRLGRRKLTSRITEAFSRPRDRAA